MAGDWQGFALAKAELLSGRLKDLLSSGQGLVRAQFGMDLGLTPELYPTWFILGTAAAALLLLLALSWATVCGLLAGKKRGGGGSGSGSGSPQPPVLRSGGTGEPHAKAPLSRAPKAEEPKKRNRKKPLEKSKTQSNGQLVSAAQEQVKAPEVVSKPKPSPPVKTEKAPEVPAAPVQVKKEKKKAKASVKPVQPVAASEGKEPDDGAWETKVSNREKKQQRRKEKGPESSGSPGGAETTKAHAGSSVAPAPTNTKKSRGNHEAPHSRAAGKADAPRGTAPAGRREEPSLDAGWTDFSLKMPGQMGAMEASKWGAIPPTARYRAQPDQQPWTQETQAWSSIDGRIKTERSSVPFTMLGMKPTDATSKSMELQSSWEGRPAVDDEWSGINGVAAVDTSSDWNAPAEHWGNYEEPPAMVTPAPLLKEQPLPSKVSDDEKDGEDPTGAAAKSKKRRKKKKKSEEESAAEAQVGNTLPKPQELPMSAAPKKQNPSISSSHKKSEPTVEPPKPSQKKKTRRET